MRPGELGLCHLRAAWRAVPLSPLTQTSSQSGVDKSQPSSAVSIEGLLRRPLLALLTSGTCSFLELFGPLLTSLRCGNSCAFHSGVLPGLFSCYATFQVLTS